ncbi:MAG: M61 family metallopeptidase [Nannocystis sp.]|nr:M61 family metallopeptidase [Nannocystis sp.]
MARSALALVIASLFAAATPSQAWARRPRAAPAAAAAPAVRYRLAIPDPASQYVEIEMVVEGARGVTAGVAMPAWTPGSYVIRDHARRIFDLRAEDLEGRPLTLGRGDKQTWLVSHGGRPFRVRYRLFADEMSVRTNHVDDRHASLVGPATFLYVVGELERAAEVTIALPPGWRAFSALPQRDVGAAEVRLAAASYDALADAPIELGAPELRRFQVEGKTIELVMTAPAGHNAELDRLSAELERIVRAFAAMMGALPFSRYVFLVHAAATNGGGLEHADSSSLQVRRDQFAEDRGYEGFAHLAAHEFFHLWNVKRIRDQALTPYDYAREGYTRLLWFHEGFTETLENLALVRAGITAPAQHLRELAEGWTAYRRRPGRGVAPIGEHSYDAWIKGYKPAANHGAVMVSYYEKGGLIGACLDLELRLRAASRGQRGGLDGLFRRLMRSHGASGRGITQAAIVAAASAEAGEDMSDFFERYVDGTEELPLPALMAKVGVRVTLSSPWEGEAAGLKERRARAWAGLRTSDLKVMDIEPGSPASAAGLMYGDEVVAVAGRRVRGDQGLREHLADHPVGAAVELTLFRGDRLERRRLTLAEDPHKTYRFELAPREELGPTVLALRDAWLAGPPAAKAPAGE